MIQEFTKEEKKKAKNLYKKSLKFNPEAHQKAKRELQSIAIDLKRKSKPGHYKNETEETRELSNQFEGRDQKAEFLITKHHSGYNLGWTSVLTLSN